MKRMLYRMVLCNEDEEYTLPRSMAIRGYCAQRHHEAICSVFSRSFEAPPWSSDWDEFDEFDPNGAFVAEDVGTSEAIGYVLSFRRCDYGYISVLAVVLEYHRQGIGFALVRRAVRYLRGLGLRTIKVDAFVDSTPAVNLYRKLGFQVESTSEWDKESAMSKQIRLIFPDENTVVIAELLETQAPETCRIIWEHLPFEGELWHGQWSGPETYLQIDPSIRIPAENQTFHVVAGDVGYYSLEGGRLLGWPDDMAEVAFFYDRGARPSMMDGPVPMNIFARMVENLEGFAEICRRIRREGVKRFRVERVL